MCDGHRKRLRNRFLEKGLQGLTEEEIVELLLTLGTPRRDCKATAREAIRRFGSLAGVLEAPLDELIKVPGIGERNCVAIRLIHEVGRAFLRSRLHGRPYKQAQREVMQFLQHRLRMETREVFIVIFMDKRNNIIGIEEFPEGRHQGTSIYPRQVIKRALDLDAFHLVLAHNHPGDAPYPSENDIRTTEALKRICAPLEIILSDHLVVTSISIFSFAAHGLL